MKKKMTLIAILFVVFCWPCQGIAKQNAEVDNPVFTFDPIPEGLHASHGFVIKNTGDTLLTIEKVSPP